MQNMTCSQLGGFIVQLLEHCTGLAEIIIASIVQISARMTSLSRIKIFLLETLQNEGWSTGIVHGPGP